MSNRVTPRMKDLVTSPIKDKENQKLFDQLNSQSKILDKALSNIRNLKEILLVNKSKTTVIVTYEEAGTGPIELEDFDNDEINSMIFKAHSELVGTGGMTVQLYDLTNGTEIATLTFLDADDSIDKTIEVKDYFTPKSGIIIMRVNVKRDVVGSGSTLCCARLIIK